MPPLTFGRVFTVVFLTSLSFSRRADKGYTITELIIAIALLVLLASIVIVFYGEYRRYAVRAVLISDLRNCITHIANSRQASDGSVEDVVSQCPKSPTTESINLVGTNPIILRASSVDENITCTYHENKGQVNCEFPY